MGHGEGERSCVAYLWEKREAQGKGGTLSIARPDADMMSGDYRREMRTITERRRSIRTMTPTGDVGRRHWKQSGRFHG